MKKQFPFIMRPGVRGSKIGREENYGAFQITLPRSPLRPDEIQAICHYSVWRIISLDKNLETGESDFVAISESQATGNYHADVPHVDSYLDIPHGDGHGDSYGDQSHLDFHSDAYIDHGDHADYPHTDAHSDHEDGGPYFDLHLDEPHADVDYHNDAHFDTHDDFHLDEYLDSPHVDSLHQDAHQDASHADAEY